MIAFGIRSWYSYSGGFLSPRDSVLAAKEAGATSLSFADRGELAGYSEFMDAAKEFDMGVIPGIELSVRYKDDARPALLFACSKEHEQALWRAVAKSAPASPDTYDLPCVAVSDLPKGLALFSGIEDSHAQNFLWKRDVAEFRGFIDALRAKSIRVAMTIPHGSLDKGAAATLAQFRSSLKMFPYSPLVYPKGKDHDFANASDYVFRSKSSPGATKRNMSIRTMEAIATEEDCLFAPSNPSILETMAFAPTSTTPPPLSYRGKTEAEIFTSLSDRCHDRLRSFIAEIDSRASQPLSGTRRTEYQDRLELELGAIHKTGSAALLQMAADFQRQLEQAGCRGKARGSAINSLAVFLLQLSEINPVYEQLQFERFVNSERFKEPDIDLDVSRATHEQGRLAILDQIPGTFLFRQFTKATMAGGLAKCARSLDMRRPDELLRDIAKSMDIPSSELRGRSVAELRDAIPDFDSKFCKARPTQEEAKLIELLSILEHFNGRPTNSTLHVAVGMCPERIETYAPPAPVELAGAATIAAAAPYNHPSLKAFRRVDIIANADMDFLDRVADLVAERSGDILTRGVPNMEDNHFRSIFHSGRVAGIPQFRNQQSLVAKCAPSSFPEVCVINALIRLTGSNDIIERFTSDDHEERLLADLEGLPPKLTDAISTMTEETRHVIIYDEQFAGALTSLSGMDPNSADSARQSLKKGEPIPAAIRDAAKAGLSEAFGTSSEQGDRVLEFLTSNGTYLFPKGHAYAYGAAICQLAVAKADYTAEFTTAFVQHFRAEDSPMSSSAFAKEFAEIAADARCLGVHLLSPMKNGELIIHSAPEGASLPGFTPGTATRKSVRLGLDAFPKVSSADIESLTSGGKPVTEECINLISALQSNQEAARTAALLNLGFLPDDLHPGFLEKAKGTRFFRMREGVETKPTALTCYLLNTFEPRGFDAGWSVGASFTNHLGDPPLYASRFFSKKNGSADEVHRFAESLRAFSPFDPLSISVSSRVVNGRTHWNIESARARRPDTSTIISLEQSVERAAAITRAVTKEPLEQDGRGH